jgi:hydroxypyruvate isomerase
MIQPDDQNPISRRNFGLGAMGTGLLAAGVAATAASAATADEPVDASKGKLNQSLCRWCFSSIKDNDELFKQAKAMGLVGIDLLTPGDFDKLKSHGLICTMVMSHKLDQGLCDTKYWDESLQMINEAIEATSAAGWRNVICFSGNARGIDRKTGLKNCAEALRKIVPVAEKKKVILNMELLNSRVDHADYMCDNSAWGIELVKEVGSKNFKLLYDIYHMQIMEGDIIRSIQKNHEYFGHYHTAGNPGRHELDDTQELYYPPIAKAIAETGFDGYFAHEFIPTKDPITSLRSAVKLCMV